MKCWYCEKTEIVDTNDGFHPFKKCPECGATWCDVPKPGGFVLAMEKDLAVGGMKYKSYPLPKRKKAKK